MKIVNVSVYVVTIPMRVSVDHTLAQRSLAENIIVGVADEQQRWGWGECCPRDYVTGETLATVQTSIREQFAAMILEWQFDSFAAVIEALQALGQSQPKNRLAAFCAIELAVLDLAGKCFNYSSGDAIGPVCRNQVFYSGVIASEHMEQVQYHAFLMSRMDISQVKVKLGADLAKNRRIIETARACLGNDVELRGDANCAWDSDNCVEQLEGLSDLALAGIEQPVAAANIAAMRRLKALRICPLIVDESLCSYEDGVNLIQQDACDIFNLRISKCGGLLNSRRLYDLALRHGIGCQLGAQVGETGLLSAAGVHVATRCANVIWFEGCYGRFLLEDDVVTPDMVLANGGEVQALYGDGLGVQVEREKLTHYTTHQESFPA